MHPPPVLVSLVGGGGGILPRVVRLLPKAKMHPPPVLVSLVAVLGGGARILPRVRYRIYLCIRRVPHCLPLARPLLEKRDLHVGENKGNKDTAEPLLHIAQTGGNPKDSNEPSTSTYSQQQQSMRDFEKKIPHLPGTLTAIQQYQDVTRGLLKANQ